MRSYLLLFVLMPEADKRVIKIKGYVHECVKFITIVQEIMKQ